MTEQEKVVAQIAATIFTIPSIETVSEAVALAWKIVNEVKDTTSGYSRE